MEVHQLRDGRKATGWYTFHFCKMKCTFGLNILQAFILPVDIQTRHDHFFARRRWQLPVEKDGSTGR